MNKAYCIGCFNDVYNHGLNGIEECWGLESAKLVKRIKVSIDVRPPFDNKPITVPDCYCRQRYMFLRPEEKE